jgi:hypothetical protein
MRPHMTLLVSNTDDDPNPTLYSAEVKIKNIYMLH